MYKKFGPKITNFLALKNSLLLTHRHKLTLYLGLGWTNTYTSSIAKSQNLKIS
jgi:hypothetical protein